MDPTRTLQRVIDSEYTLAKLETNQGERLVALFKRLALTTGRAVYHWTPESGLYRLGVEHIFIPRTRAAADVLAYVSASRHYGIYLLEGFQAPLQKASIQRALSEVAAKDGAVRRVVILLGEEIHVPAGVKARVASIRHNVRPRERAQA